MIGDEVADIFGGVGAREVNAESQRRLFKIAMICSAVNREMSVSVA